MAASPTYPVDAQAWCEYSPGEKWSKTAKGEWAEIVRDGEVETLNQLRYRALWQGRLDKDKREDLILATDCNEFQCSLTVLLQCGDGTYTAAWRGFGSEVKVRPVRGGWSEFQVATAETNRAGKRYLRWWGNIYLGRLR